MCILYIQITKVAQSTLSELLHFQSAKEFTLVSHILRASKCSEWPPRFPDEMPQFFCAKPGCCIHSSKIAGTNNAVIQLSLIVEHSVHDRGTEADHCGRWWWSVAWVHKAFNELPTWYFAKHIPMQWDELFHFHCTRLWVTGRSITIIAVVPCGCLF